MFKNQAKKIFKQICCIMGDCGYKDSRDLAWKVIEKGKKWAILKDEIYCQIIKQTTRNPNIKNCMKGWKLLYLCLSTFSPSIEMVSFFFFFFFCCNASICFFFLFLGNVYFITYC